MLRAKLALAILPLEGRTWAFMKPQSVYWHLSSSTHSPLNLSTKSHNDDGCHYYYYYYYLSSQWQHFVSSQGVNYIAKFSQLVLIQFSNQKPFLRFLGFYFVWTTELRAPLESPLCREVVMGCFKPTVHGLRYLPELVLSGRSETPFLSRNSLWRAPGASKRSHSDSHCTSAMHQIQGPGYEEEEKLSWAEIWPTHLLSLTRAQVTWPHHSCVFRLPLPGAWEAKNASFNLWGLKENYYKTIYYFWIKTLFRLSCIGRYHWHLLSFLMKNGQISMV